MRERHEGQRPGRVAAFDIGSNTVRGIAAHVPPSGRLAPFRRAFRTTALGRRLATTGRLDRAAIESTADFVESFVRGCGPFDEVWAVATAAARDATDTADLAAAIDRPRWTAQQIAYVLRKTGAIDSTG